jgi:protein-disulfide isomerase
MSRDRAGGGKGPRKSAAQLVREQRARERRRQRLMWISVGVVTVLVIAGLIGWSVYATNKAGDFTAPAGVNAEQTGVVSGSGPVTVDLYADFMCPACKQFEERVGPTLQQLVDEGKITLVVHPVAYLDRYSTTEYSTRAAVASGCAAEAGKFQEYVAALFSAQPAQGGAGLSNDQLVDLGTGVGLDDGSFGSCVRDQKFAGWTRHVTEEASRGRVTGTPTVRVNGEVVQNSVEAITSAVSAANG